MPARIGENKQKGECDMEYPVYNLSPEQEAQRRKNYETVVLFMAQKGPERGKVRGPLFTEDAVVELFYTVEGEPFCQPAAQWSEMVSRLFPIWSYPETELFVTQYPDRFLGFTRAVGEMQGKPSDSHYYIYFECRDGKISLYREMYNPTVRIEDL